MLRCTVSRPVSAAREVGRVHLGSNLSCCTWSGESSQLGWSTIHVSIRCIQGRNVNCILLLTCSCRSEVARFEELPPEAAAECGCWSPEDYRMRWVKLGLRRALNGWQAGEQFAALEPW